jgi:endoglucanase
MRKNRISRRTFLEGAAVAMGLGAAGLSVPAVGALPEPTAAKLPLWHGVNLLEKFMMPNNGRYLETDFEWLSELGFNFARLPLDYRCWIDGNDWTQFREDVLKEIDEAVAFGDKHGVHVLLNFHRAPGYTVAAPREAKDLWKDEDAQQVCATHWGRFAERYAGIPNTRLSFNLFNEPAKVTPDEYRHVVTRMLDAIRKHDEKRLVICDGRMYGQIPPDELLGLGVAAATRGYDPFHLTHYQAGWVKGADKFELPTYPIQEGDTLWNKDALRAKRITPWKALEAKGMGVMAGEFGAFNKTPHGVVLSWLRDYVDLWKEAVWGWAMWNFRGSFGFLDSERADVAYQDFHGHKLDRAMLDVLKAGM